MEKGGLGGISFYFQIFIFFLAHPVSGNLAIVWVAAFSLPEQKQEAGTGENSPGTQKLEEPEKNPPCPPFFQGGNPARAIFAKDLLSG
ncbi:MAG: hypothetical protein ABIM40_10085 [Pseudomonadota bacterium]